jgi:hypothetical protein
MQAGSSHGETPESRQKMQLSSAAGRAWRRIAGAAPCFPAVQKPPRAVSQDRHVSWRIAPGAQGGVVNRGLGYYQSQLQFGACKLQHLAGAGISAGSTVTGACGTGQREMRQLSGMVKPGGHLLYVALFRHPETPGRTVGACLQVPVQTLCSLGADDGGIKALPRMTDLWVPPEGRKRQRACSSPKTSSHSRCACRDSRPPSGGTRPLVRL